MAKQRDNLRFSILMALLVILALGVVIERTLETFYQNESRDRVDTMARVNDLIREHHADELDDSQLLEEGIRGMVKSLKDPNTVYFTPSDLKEFQEKIDGFSGIGANVRTEQVEGGQRIVFPTVLPGFPASEAGVEDGDMVYEIDGINTLNLSQEDAISHIKGEVDTVVILKVKHADGEFEDIRVVRGWVKNPTVKSMFKKADNQDEWDFVLDRSHGIGYVRLLQFSDRTAAELRDAMKHLLSEGEMRGLILDLRGNGGGLLRSAVDVCDLYLDKGLEVVSIEGRKGKRTTFVSEHDDMLEGLPMVILVDELSASASEIVAGALKDHGRAKIVGTRSYGKGSVQQMFYLGQGLGAIKLTNAYYYLPSNRNIHRRRLQQGSEDEAETSWGVDPDEGFYVRIKYADRQRRLDELDDVESSTKKYALPENMTGQWISKKMYDVQLGGAVETMRGLLDTGIWHEVGERGVEELAIRRTKIDELMRKKHLHDNRVKQLRSMIVEEEKKLNGK